MQIREARETITASVTRSAGGSLQICIHFSISFNGWQLGQINGIRKRKTLIAGTCHLSAHKAHVFVSLFIWFRLDPMRAAAHTGRVEVLFKTDNGLTDLRSVVAMFAFRARLQDLNTQREVRHFGRLRSAGEHRISPFPPGSYASNHPIEILLEIPTRTMLAFALLSDLAEICAALTPAQVISLRHDGQASISSNLSVRPRY